MLYNNYHDDVCTQIYQKTQTLDEYFVYTRLLFNNIMSIQVGKYVKYFLGSYYMESGDHKIQVLLQIFSCRHKYVILLCRQLTLTSVWLEKTCTYVILCVLRTIKSLSGTVRFFFYELGVLQSVLVLWRLYYKSIIVS